MFFQTYAIATNCQHPGLANRGRSFQDAVLKPDVACYRIRQIGQGPGFVAIGDDRRGLGSIRLLDPGGSTSANELL
jgi:hypothetical protein